MAEPSRRARELLHGAYDTHIHVAPDVVEREVDDVSLARQFAARGMAGFVLKSHYTATAERASVVRAAVPDVQALGAIVLNRAVGGMNPLAVEIAAREGARTVWLPTVDAVNEAGEREHVKAGAKVPVWVKLQLDLREQGLEIEPVPVVDERGEVLDETRAVLELIARHELLLATGHISRDEIFAVVDSALKHGVRQIVITHPEFPAQSLTVEDQRAARGTRSTAGALLHHAAHRQDQLGELARERPCVRAGELGPVDRSGTGVQPARPGRSGADGRPAAPGRVRRAGGASDGGCQHAPGGRSRAVVSGRRMLVIGAHSADFVWRAGGAIAVNTSAGGVARVIALSYGERGESGELWKEEGQTIERVKQIRHGEAERAAAAVGAEFASLDLGDYPLEIDRDGLAQITDQVREFAPDVLITHTDTDPFNPDHPVAHAAVVRARSLAAGAGVQSAFKTVRPPELFLFEPHQPELCNFTPTLFVDITRGD